MTRTKSIAYLFLFFAGVTCSNGINAQVFVQLEKYNSLKRIKFFPGQSISYRTTLGKKIWYHGTIQAIDPLQKLLYLDHTILKIKDITHVKSYKNRTWSNAIAQSLRIFGISWTAFAIADQFVGNTDWRVNAIAAGGAIALSLPIQLIFKSKTHKIGPKYKLRIIDLNM